MAGNTGTSLDPWQVILSLGGGLLGGLFAPETPTPQQLQSFSGAGNVSPIALLNKAMGDADTLNQRFSGTTYSLPDATVMPVPGYSGGALPMRIGGFGVPENLTHGLDESAVVRRAPATTTSALDPAKTEARQDQRDLRRAQPEQDTGLGGGRGDAVNEALTALDMLRTRDWVGPNGRR